jgi:DnaK suppressor protein
MSPPAAGAADARARTMMPTNLIRSHLVQRRRELLARYRGALVRAEEELAARDVELVERASEEWDARVLTTLSHADLEELGRITAAIERIDRGTYGNCADCGLPIEEGRLSALPATTTCFDCASGHELMSRVAVA